MSDVLPRMCPAAPREASMVNTAPPPGRFSTPIVPPWLTMTCRAMLKPRPDLSPAVSS